MVTTNQFITRICMFACVCIATVSCSKDEFFEKDGSESSEEKVANTFDFSTTQDVDLIVDYSDFEIYGPVLFSVYNVNPIVKENTIDEYVDEDVEPIYEAYTDAQGKFDATITLPAYAKVLHVVTGNVFIGLRRAVVEVINGEAKVKVDKNTTWAARATRATTFTGESTDNLEHKNTNLYNLWNAVDKNYKPGNIYFEGSMPYATSGTATQVCKRWHTPLGTWNSASGRPDYLLNPSTATPGLTFSNDVINGMFATIQNALSSGKSCHEQYRAGADLMLIKDSEVSITALGSFTWWNSSLGYYYYTGNKPTNLMDVDIIMVFPNTQDGQRDLSWDYQGNIGMQRGDVIQLMYYPNIANNGDLSGATTIFPKGTSIGFVLKSNAWGMIDKDHSIEYVSRQGNGIRRYNVWHTSTEGLSFAAKNYWHTGDFKDYCMSPNGESRTAKFAYKDKNGNSYTIISFEDACNDQDYDDVIFAVNPANVFTEQAQVEQGKSTTHGVYAFEDMWPEPGDYDMNDVMVYLEHEKSFSSQNVKKQVFSLTTYQNYVTLKSGLAMKLVAKSAPSSIVMKKKAKGNTTTANFTKDGDYYYLTEDITGELGTTYIFELTYSNPISLSDAATVQPFLYRKESDGKQWEVHIPGEAPTDKMNTSYFGQGDDCSNLNAKKYFVRRGDYPFAFYMDNARIAYFEEILKRENESSPIDVFFPEFIGWSTSKGKKNQDWYLHPAGK